MIRKCGAEIKFNHGMARRKYLVLTTFKLTFKRKKALGILHANRASATALIFVACKNRPIIGDWPLFIFHNRDFISRCPRTASVVFLEKER